jgi:acyl-coenzyme A synthetase/AMP-(fatty) acid ligase
MYGLTECKRVAYLDPVLFLEKTNSCGREMNGVTADIVDAAEKPVPPGGIGELTVTGENVCAGYWADPVATQRRFRTGPEGKRVLFTGDYFRRDKDGYLEFIGRADELVKVRDELVSLGTIETELRRSKLVLDLTLRMGMDDLGIPLLSAFIVPEGPWVTESEILKSFRQYISRPGHLPHKVLLLNELPVNGHGKHDKAPNLDQTAEGAAI